MLDFIRGKRTHIVNIVQAALLMAAAVGFQVDAEATMDLVTNSIEWVEGGIILFAAGIAYFRQLGKKKQGNMV